MLNRKMILAAIAAMNLMPAAAFGADRFKDLTASELNSSFMNFKPVKEGSDPNSQVVLYGMMFADCAPHFRFANTSTDVNLKSDGTAGFRISDPKGDGRACMARHKDASHTCSEETPCKPLSGIPGARLDLSSLGDVKIQILHHDPNQDRDANQWEKIPGLSDDYHKSGATLQAEQKAAAEERRQARIDQLRGQLGCRKTLDDISSARTARDLLVGMKVLSPEQAEKIDKQLAKSEFDLLARNFRKIKLTDEEGTAAAIEELKAFEAEHPEVAESVAVLLYEKAKEVVSGPKANPESYNRAASLISEAQSLTGLSDAAVAKLDGYQRDITLGKLQKQAEAGTIDPASYQSLVYSVQNDLRSCNTPQMLNTEACQNSVRAYQTASMIPQKVQQSQYEQAMFYARMQQTMMSMGQMGGSSVNMNAGMPQQQGSGFYK